MGSQFLMILALLPAIGLLITIYACDRNKEPKKLLVGIFFMGMGTIVSAMILELIGMAILENAVYDDMLKALLSAFIVVAPAEELGKFLAMRVLTWKNKNFDYLFDGIVYAVFSSLGFAAFENVLYVMQNGVGTGIVRALASVPGHACFAVFMGYFYSRAKHASVTGKKMSCLVNTLLAMIVPIVLHGAYDALLMVAEESYEDSMQIGLMIAWIVMLVGMFVGTIILIVKTSRNDFRIVILEDNTPVVYSGRMLGNWNCTCGRVNISNYCTNCGNKRPMVERWTCSRCGYLSYWNFCGKCGSPKQTMYSPVVNRPMN